MGHCALGYLRSQGAVQQTALRHPLWQQIASRPCGMCRRLLVACLVALRSGYPACGVPRSECGLAVAVWVHCY